MDTTTDIKHSMQPVSGYNGTLILEDMTEQEWASYQQAKSLEMRQAWADLFGV